MKMIYHYRYWDNNTGKVTFDVDAEDLLAADEAFEKATGLNPLKHPWIGVEIVKENV
jgi:hypothetical protein